MGQIPSHWRSVSVKHLASRITDGAHVSPDIAGGPYPFISTRDLTPAGIDFEGALTTSKESFEQLARYGCRPKSGDILFSKDGTIGRTTVVTDDREFVVASSLIIITPDIQQANPAFLDFLFQSAPVQEQVRSFVKGTGLPRISIRNLNRIKGLLPTLTEQHGISQFLTREVTRIDSLIAKQERLIELLAEKRQAIITHAVTKGMDPTACTKPSGVPWQGPVPEHWTVQPFKNLTTMQTGVTLGKDYSNEITETYAYLRVANVQIGYVDLSEVKEIDLPPAVAASSTLRPGDVLMTEGGDRDKLARGCIWDAPIRTCVHQNHIFAVRTGDQLLNEFLVLALDADPARTYFYMTGKQSTNLASTNSTTVKNFRLGVPPIAEQRQIVSHLSVKTGQIDVLISKASLVIAALKERRSALISAAVTGKIKVTDKGVKA